MEIYLRYVADTGYNSTYIWWTYDLAGTGHSSFFVFVFVDLYGVTLNTQVVYLQNVILFSKDEMKLCFFSLEKHNKYNNNTN